MGHNNQQLHHQAQRISVRLTTLQHDLPGSARRNARAYWSNSTKHMAIYALLTSSAKHTVMNAIINIFAVIEHTALTSHF